MDEQRKPNVRRVSARDRKDRLAARPLEFPPDAPPDAHPDARFMPPAPPVESAPLSEAPPAPPPDVPPDKQLSPQDTPLRERGGAGSRVSSQRGDAGAGSRVSSERGDAGAGGGVPPDTAAERFPPLLGGTPLPDAPPVLPASRPAPAAAPSAQRARLYNGVTLVFVLLTLAVIVIGVTLWNDPLNALNPFPPPRLRVIITATFPPAAPPSGGVTPDAGTPAPAGADLNATPTFTPLSPDALTALAQPVITATPAATTANFQFFGGTAPSATPAP